MLEHKEWKVRGVMEVDDIYDITIIGGGPGGLYSAFYAGLRDLKTKILEYQSSLGGKLHVYPEKFIWDIGGLPGTPAYKVMENLVEQGLTFKPTVHLNTKVDFVTKQDDLFVIETSAGEKHFSKKVIVAARLEKYGEHENDHQLQIADSFDKDGYVLHLKDFDKLGEYIKNIYNFHPKKFKSNTINFCNKLKYYIDNN